MWNVIYNYYPECAKGRFNVTFSNAINSANCRLTSPCFRVEREERTLSYQGFKLWNQEIYNYIKNQNTVKNFTKNLLRKFVKQYRDPIKSLLS